MKNIFEIINCPVCGGVMRRDGKTLLCDSGHSFDVSKSGYVNMLPPGREKNSRTGDEREMVKARVDFLSKGYYSEISGYLGQLLSNQVSGDDITICDMGCGEGYHTCRVADIVRANTGANVVALGYDASKYAAEYASKHSKSRGFMPKAGIGVEFDSHCQAYFMPANIFSLPMFDSTADIAVSMFAPIAWEEASRILRKGGILAVVSSGKNHLIEMRKIIYEEVHLSDSLPMARGNFREVARDSLQYTAHIENEQDIKSLFMMTPFYYKTTEAGRNNLFERKDLTVTVDVNYSLFEVI